ncbi:MAG: hypothetical protein GY772_14635 [bacterium]|nr:hypothetical protein [bacterium]
MRYSAFSGRFRAHSGFAAQALDGIRVQKDPTLRRAALAALVSAGGSDVGELQHIAGMLRGLDSSAVEAWVRDLELLGARPATEVDFQALGGDETHVGRFAFWWFLVGAEAQAEAAALALVESEGGLESLALSLREPLAHGRRAEVLAWIQSLQRIAPRQKQRLALRLSLIEAPAALLHLEQTLAQSKSSAQDLMDLAYLVPMEPLGSRAQAALIEALEQQPVPEGLAAALEQAQFNLRGTGAFLQAEEFEANLRRRAVRLSHPLTERILEDSWARRSLGIAGSPLRVPLGSLETRPPR